jgi:hypothetical protein
VTVALAGGGIYVSGLFFVQAEAHIIQITRTEAAWGRVGELSASCNKLRAYLQNYAGKVPGLLLDLRTCPVPVDDAEVSATLRKFLKWLSGAFLRTAVVVKRGAEKELHQQFAQADGTSLHVFLNEAFARAYLGA